MPKSGLLIGVAVILIAVAVGVAVWTNFFELSSGPTSVQLDDAKPSNGGEVATLVAAMNEVANSSGYAATFQPDDSHKWNIDDGHKIERFQLTDANVGFARISSSAVLNPEVVHIGASVFWPVELTQKFNGKRIQVGVVMRASSTNPTPEFSVLFATRQAGNSGWQKMKTSTKFELKHFEFDVPVVAEGYANNPMIVIHADPEGRSRAIDLLGIVVREAPR